MDSEGLEALREIMRDPVFGRAHERVRRGETVNPEDSPHPEGFDTDEEFEEFLVWLYSNRQRNWM
jgi:hypothetical protein